MPYRVKTVYDAKGNEPLKYYRHYPQFRLLFFWQSFSHPTFDQYARDNHPLCHHFTKDQWSHDKDGLFFYTFDDAVKYMRIIEQPSQKESKKSNVTYKEVVL